MSDTQFVPISRPSSLGLRNYPHVYPPPGFTPFNRVGSETVAVNGSYTLNAGQQILIPTNQKGWITQIAIFLGSYGNGQTWTLFIGGTAVRDYTNVPTPLGAVETPVVRHIELLPGQSVGLSFSNKGTTNLAARWMIYGWYYNQGGR